MLVEPALNGFKNVLMLPSCDPPLLGGSATMLDGTALADVGQITQPGQMALGCPGGGWPNLLFAKPLPGGPYAVSMGSPVKFLAGDLTFTIGAAS
jgi:hypothetical protein